QERFFVCLRRFVEAADLSNELERSSSNLVCSDGRIEVEKHFDISAHFYDLHPFKTPERCKAWLPHFTQMALCPDRPLRGNDSLKSQDTLPSEFAPN
ncbi:MAG TPA: hypothetical protein VK608_01330, partial [Edaphobacter sp.]|nr:hypothetical protein [Edaphobacter sp.]